MALLWLALSLLGAPGADVRVTNSHLVVMCVAGRPVAPSQRRWDLSEATSLVFTMHNEPRSGIENREPGIAEVTFTPQAGHRYEVEVRADASAYARRVWPRGEWKPVVRDRTTNAIVSSDPRWLDHGCAPLRIG